MASSDSESYKLAASDSETSDEDTGPVFAHVPSRVAAGHCSRDGTGIYIPSGVGPVRSGQSRTLLKTYDATEYEVYRRLADDYRDDPVQRFTPQLLDVTNICDQSGVNQKCIRMSNLLFGFLEPKVMDIKLGVRTFLESECNKLDLRVDLYQKMKELYPSQVTEAEHVAGAVTKHRFMSVRDATSTIGTLGFRVDGVAGYRREGNLENDKLTDFRTREDALGAFLLFVSVAANGDLETPFPAATPHVIATQLYKQLRSIQAAMQESTFVHRHEFIGSSLLLIADHRAHTGVNWIDFAKTCPVANDRQITHLRPWSQGNHEDGILLGINELVEIWGEMVQTVGEHDTPKSLARRSSVKLQETNLEVLRNPNSSPHALLVASPRVKLEVV